MESYEAAVLKKIGYVLFLIVLAVYVFDIGGSNAETVDACDILRNMIS